MELSRHITDTTADVARRRRPRATTLGAVAGWVMAVGGLTSAGALGAAGVRSGAEGAVGPVAAAPAAPPVAPQPRSDVALDPGVVGSHYIACIRAAGGSADTAEHWSAVCVERANQEATIAALERECVRDVPGSADAVEARAAACGQRAQVAVSTTATERGCERAAATADAMEHRSAVCSGSLERP